MAEERDRKSAEAGLRSAEAQAEDQRKLLYQTELELATSRQLMLDLKAQLQVAKEATQLVKEASEAEKQASYQLAVEETQARLTEELAEACREFCIMTWDEALNAAGVPADSPLRRPERVYFHPHIRATDDDTLSDGPNDAKVSEAEAKEVDSLVPDTTTEVRGEEAEVRGEEPVAKDASTSQPAQQEDPPVSEA